MSDNLVIRAVVQRAKYAEVLIEQKSQGLMDYGLLILLGIGFNNVSEEIKEEQIPYLLEKYNSAIEKLADKILNLRIFQDTQEKMNLSVQDINGGIYIVSQFTLFGDCRKGNRPSFILSAKPNLAELFYNRFIDIIKDKFKNNLVLCGKFAANMKVNFCNDGPVTLIIDATLKGIM